MNSQQPAGQSGKPSLLRTIRRAGKYSVKRLLFRALLLRYAFPDAPLRTKALILFTLAYFISPIDGIPDLIPMLGYTDDAALLMGALLALSACIREGHKEKARRKLDEWFGE